MIKFKYYDTDKINFRFQRKIIFSWPVYRWFILYRNKQEMLRIFFKLKNSRSNPTYSGMKAIQKIKAFSTWFLVISYWKKFFKLTLSLPRRLTILSFSPTYQILSHGTAFIFVALFNLNLLLTTIICNIIVRNFNLTENTLRNV